MHARNAGLQRLRAITARVGIATTVLAGVFAGLAAAGNSGHHKRSVSAPGTTGTTSSSTVPAPPSLPPLQGEDGGSAPSSTPAAPQASPAQTQQPPVVTSGGS